MRALVRILLLVFVLSATCAHAASLQVEPEALYRGQPALARLCVAKPAKAVVIDFLDRKFPLFPIKGGCFAGPVGVDLKAKPGKYVMRAMADGKQAAAVKLLVEDKDYGVRRITVDPKFMRLTKAQLARHRKEMARQRPVYASMTQRIYWENGFEKPVNGVVVGPFGRRSVINGQDRSPHGGVDFRAAQGAPIKAAAGGKVVLVDDTFFGGWTVLIDHGQGLITGYRHLSAALVKPGQDVRKGQIIAKAGATGRVTGPHLHFDVHLAGARLDPEAWIKASRKLAPMIQGGS